MLKIKTCTIDKESKPPPKVIYTGVELLSGVAEEGVYLAAEAGHSRYYILLKQGEKRSLIYLSCRSGARNYVEVGNPSPYIKYELLKDAEIVMQVNEK